MMFFLHGIGARRPLKAAPSAENCGIAEDFVSPGGRQRAAFRLCLSRAFVAASAQGFVKPVARYAKTPQKGVSQS